MIMNCETETAEKPPKYRRLYDLLQSLPVDARTLRKGATRKGIKIITVGNSGPLVETDDFNKILTEGIPYHQDRMTTKGIR
jgi:hypothetical protein